MGQDKGEYRNFGYVQLSRRCNNSCLFCSQPKFDYDLPLEEAKSRITTLKGKGVNEIIFTGGEPTLNRDLAAIVRFTKNIGLELRMITNGINLADAAFVHGLVLAGLQRVVISIHAHDKGMHEELSQNPGSFEKALEGIGAAVAEGMRVSFNITINSKNCGSLSGLVRFLAGRYPSVRHYVFNNLDITGNAEKNPGIIARLADFELELARALGFLQSSGRTFRVERVPLCYMAGYEEFSSETRRIVKGQMFRVWGKEKDFDFLREVTDFHREKAAQCNACSLAGICAGIDAKYAKMYGTSELYPLFEDQEKIRGMIIGQTKAPLLPERVSAADSTPAMDQSVSPPISVDAMVLEPTRLCDINCAFCNGTEDSSLSFELFSRIIYENKSLPVPIKHVELGGSGNPLLHKDIIEMLALLVAAGNSVSIVTNGCNLVEHVSKIGDGLLPNVHFGIYLDSPQEGTNDRLMGAGAFRKTIASCSYLKSRGAQFDILMRLTPANFSQVEDMLLLCKKIGANLLLPMEVFPISGSGFQLSDAEKVKALENMNCLSSRGEPVFRMIHFEKPAGNCTYLREKRIFINSRGSLSFCHFLSALPNSRITGCGDKGLGELLQINRKVREEFAKKKAGEMQDWHPKRETASPCGFCLYCHGGGCGW